MTTQKIITSHWTEEREVWQACADCGKNDKVVLIENLCFGSGGYDEDDVLCRPCYIQLLEDCGVEQVITKEELIRRLEMLSS